jgi:hypothetical protein
MKSGGSSGGAPPNTPQPQGSRTTPYGNATPFNPQFASYLPPEGSAASAMLGDAPRQEYGAPTPLLEQQQAGPMTASTAPSTSEVKAMLARLLSGQAAEARDARDGGYFSGTNARRQQLLRANRSYPGDQR